MKVKKATARSKVAFVILGWNNIDILPECFESIESQSYKDKTIYYVDNNSADGSVSFVRSNFPNAIVVESKYNTGFARGNNLGITKALEDPEVGYIALLNTDARLDNEWTEHLIAFARNKPRAAVLQGTTLDYYNHAIIDSTHIYISFNGQGTQGNWRHYYQGEYGPKKVFGANAAACLITRKFIEAQPFGSQLFDEQMFMYLEDLDLSARATVMGWDNYLVPKARAYHMGSVSSGKNPGFSLYMTFRNNSAMLFKNLPMTMLIRMAPHILRGDIDTIKVLYRSQKRLAALKVIKGRLVGILQIPFYISKRRKVQHLMDIPKGYLWRLMRVGY